MPYDPADPRAQLSTATVAVAPGIPRAASYRELRADGADEAHPSGSRTWWTRSQAMVIAQTAAVRGDTLTTDAQGEHVVLLLDGATAAVRSADDSVTPDRDSVVIVPPESISSCDPAPTVPPVLGVPLIVNVGASSAG